MEFRCTVDRPEPDSISDPLSFVVSGWLFDGEANHGIASVEAYAGDEKIGETRALGLRADVSAALKLREPRPTGFQMTCYAPQLRGQTAAEIQIRVNAENGPRVVAKRMLKFI